VRIIKASLSLKIMKTLCVNLAITLLASLCGSLATAQKTYSFAKKNPLAIPQLFEAGIISTGDYDTHPAFSPSGDTIYFLKCTPDINNVCTICVSFFKGGKWTEPMVPSFSGRYMDIDPFVSADGKTIYFSSNRPIQKDSKPKTDTDIWKVTIAPSGWGEPVHLEPPVNSDADEYYPTLSDNRNLYFGSTRNNGMGGSDIYKSIYKNGVFQKPENLGASVNSLENEYEPFISPDESFLIFMATVPKGLSNADLYVSYYHNGEWTKAERLPEPINSSFTEWSPKVTRDNTYFFFSSTRSIPVTLTKPGNLQELRNQLNQSGNGLGDIYQVDMSALKLRVTGK
jgi:hypothetical protein